MPFGYLEFSRAIGRKPCARGRPGSGSGSLPGPVLFERGLTSMGYAKHTHSAIRIRTAPPAAVGPVGWPTVAVVGSNRCNGSDRTVATVWLGSDQNTPPGAL